MTMKFPSEKKQISVNKYIRLKKRGISCRTTRCNLHRYFIVEKAIDSFIIDDYIYTRFFNTNKRFGINVTHCMRYKIGGMGYIKDFVVYQKV